MYHLDWLLTSCLIFLVTGGTPHICHPPWLSESLFSVLRSSLALSLRLASTIGDTFALAVLKLEYF